MSEQDDRLRNWPLTRAEVSGVGSLPYLRIGPALRFVAAQAPVVPFVPELPLLGKSETMRERVGEPAEYVKTRNAAFVAMRFPRAKLVKTQVCGPFTHAAARSERLEASTQAVIARVQFELDSLASLRQPKLLVIDEPALTALTQRAQSRVADSLRSVFDAIRQRGAYVGLHDCGTIDFGLLAAIDPDYYSFDAWHALENVFANPTLCGWLRRGRSLGLGIVPTTKPASNASVSARTLHDRIQKVYREHGLEPSRLPAPLLTGNCGFGLSSQGWLKRAHATLHALATRMHSC